MSIINGVLGQLVGGCFRNQITIDEKLDQKIRNVKIKTAWEVMKRWTDVGYVKRIETLMEQFHLSYSRIESIIKEED